jgi:1-hydroxycarotenoid 3,4-desaturase
MSEVLPVVIVGAGIGGLAAAISLAVSGEQVLVVEKSDQVGGKIRQEVVDGLAMDAGPTVLTMRWVFDDLFERAGHRFDSHVRLRKATRLARHLWTDGSQLDLFSDVDESADAIGRFAGAREAEGYRRFAEHTRRVHETVREVFLNADRPTLGSTLSAIGKVGLGALFQVEGHRTLWRSLGDYFMDSRLRQLFARYATYAGSSPWMAPATLGVIAHVEREGVWLAQGGMRSVALACEQVARSQGVGFLMGSGVSELIVQAPGISGIRLESGEEIEAKAVVFNGDPSALASGLLGPDVRRAAALPKHRSLSAVTTCAVAAVQDCDLDYHTVFFSDDYEREFIQLFHEQTIPSQPTVYVCAQDRAGFDPLPAEKERLFFLVNAPAIGDSTPTENLSCRKGMLETLRRCGWELDLPPSSISTTPAQYAERFPATGGSLYGAASHGMLSPLARAPSKSRIPGLFFAGGGAHPGAGVPMAATSGLLAASAVLNNFASTRPSSKMAIAGGTSMSSATTGNVPSS